MPDDAPRRYRLRFLHVRSRRYVRSDTLTVLSRISLALAIYTRFTRDARVSQQTPYG